MSKKIFAISQNFCFSTKTILAGNFVFFSVIDFRGQMATIFHVIWQPTKNAIEDYKPQVFQSSLPLPGPTETPSAPARTSYTIPMMARLPTLSCVPLTSNFYYVFNEFEDSKLSKILFDFWTIFLDALAFYAESPDLYAADRRIGDLYKVERRIGDLCSIGREADGPTNTKRFLFDFWTIYLNFLDFYAESKDLYMATRRIGNLCSIKGSYVGPSSSFAFNSSALINHG